MVQVGRMQSLEFILRAVTLQELNYPENENFLSGGRGQAARGLSDRPGRERVDSGVFEGVGSLEMGGAWHRDPG